MNDVPHRVRNQYLYQKQILIRNRVLYIFRFQSETGSYSYSYSNHIQKSKFMLNHTWYIHQCQLACQFHKEPPVPETCNILKPRYCYPRARALLKNHGIVTPGQGPCTKDVANTFLKFRQSFIHTIHLISENRSFHSIRK